MVLCEWWCHSPQAVPRTRLRGCLHRDLIGASVGGKVGASMEAIPFNGSAQMMPQLIGGQLASGVTGTPEGVTMARGKKVRILAITGDKRSTLLPDVPTFEEQGVQGLSLSSFNAFFAPKVPAGAYRREVQCRPSQDIAGCGRPKADQ